MTQTIIYVTGSILSFNVYRCNNYVFLKCIKSTSSFDKLFISLLWNNWFFINIGGYNCNSIPFYLWILFCRQASSVSDIALVKCWCDLTKGQKQFLVVNHIIICVVYTCVYIFVLFKYLYYSLFLSVITIWKYYVCYGLKHLINDFFNSLLYRW